MEEVVLDDGTIVQCEEVSYLAVTSVTTMFPACQQPEMPVEHIKGKAGVTIVPANPGTPEYDEWERESNRVRRFQRRVDDDAPYYLGVTSWKLPGDKDFNRKVPKSWEYPVQMIELGFVPYEVELESTGMSEAGRRWDFILRHLMGKNANAVKIVNAVSGATEITAQEEQAVADKFPGDEEQEADTDIARE